MSMLLDVFRHQQASVDTNDARFLAPLWQTWNDPYYSKHLVIPAGSLPNTRKLAGTAAWKFSTANQVTYPRFMALGVTDWTTSALRWGLGATTGNMFFTCEDPSSVDVYTMTNLAGLGTMCDGTVKRFAFVLDLDDLPNSSVWINGVDMGPCTGSPTGAQIPFSSSVKLAIMTDLNGGSYFSSLAGEGVGMVSLSMTGDLNINNVFDGPYFTNPGKHFLNWYTTRPEFAFINAPYVNQGSYFRATGKKYNHTPNVGWDWQSTAESRHHKTITNPGVGLSINNGVVY